MPEVDAPPSFGGSHAVAISAAPVFDPKNVRWPRLGFASVWLPRRPHGPIGPSMAPMRRWGVDDARHPAARVRREEGPELPGAILGGIERHGPYERYFLYVLPAVQRAGVLAHGVGQRNVALSYEPSFLLLLALVKDDGVVVLLTVNYSRRPVAELQLHGHLDRQEQDEFAREGLQLLKEVLFQTRGLDLSAQNGRRPQTQLR